MTFYQIVVFLHVLGAFAMFATLGIEWAAMPPLQRATSAEQARPLLGLLASLGRVGGPSGATLLITGIYMAMTMWGHHAWISLSLLGLIAMAMLGGSVTGRRLAAIGRESAKGELDGATLQLRLQDPALALSLRLRTAIGIGIVFLMTTKPTGAIAFSAFLGAIALGAVWAMPAFGRDRVASVENVQ